MIKFLIKGQDIETLEHEVIAADQVSFVSIKFAFDNNWKPLHKVVKFAQECDEYFRVLGIDGTSCYLPAELHPGSVKMSLFGYDPDSTETVRATTVIHTLHVRPSGFEGEGNTEIPPTPDLYQQLLQQMKTGISGKSAYEIAVESGFSGTVAEWLESLKGTDGINGEKGRDGIDGQPGNDGKSAYEIAAEHGFTGTEEEWLSQMQPDLSPYVTRVETLKLIADKTGSLENSSHSHENKNVLDQITNADFTLISGLQQFEDSTNESIHTLNEGLANINGTAHTHENKAVLDSFTKADKAAINSLPQFKQGVNDDIQELRESVSTVVEQAHWHHNLTVLNGITSAKIAKWDSATEWQLLFQTLQGNVMDYQMQMNHRMEQTDETVTEIQSDIQQFRDSNQYDHQNINDAILMLENRITLLESLHENGDITLFSAGSDALEKYGENLFTVYNNAYNSLADFSKNYPHFLSPENGIYFNIDDFGWDGAVFLICTKELNLSENSQISITYLSGAAEQGELYLIQKPENINVPISVYVYTQIQNGTAEKVPFQWLYSDNFVTTLTACNVSAGTYYFAIKGRSNNTHPKIKAIKILGG